MVFSVTKNYWRWTMDKEWIRRWGDKLGKLVEKDGEWTFEDGHLYYAYVVNLKLKLHVEGDTLYHLEAPPTKLGENERQLAATLIAVAKALIN